jgi:hypothetical protein
MGRAVMGCRWAPWIVVIIVAAWAAPAPADAPPPMQAERMRMLRSADADDIIGRLSDGYRTYEDEKRRVRFVYAVDPQMFRAVRHRLIGLHAAVSEELFSEPPTQTFTVILPTLNDYRRLAPTTRATGFYHPRSRVLLSISVSTVIFHEYIHALHHADQEAAGQKHPIWLTEGLAMLYQSAEVKNAKVRVEVGQDLRLLHKAMEADRLTPLADLLTLTPRAFLSKAGVHYSQVHYLTLYLHRKGKLRDVYDAYKSSYRRDPTGRRALAETLGDRLAAIEKDWLAWAGELEPPWRPAEAGEAWLGIRMKPHKQGVRVDGLLRRSPARRAKVLKVGDVILSIAGLPTADAAALTEAVTACQPGQVVTIEVLRDGKVRHVRQLLGAARP